KETVGYDLITKNNLAEELNNDNQKGKVENLNLEEEKVYDHKEDKLDNKKLDKEKRLKDEPTCNICNDPMCPREKGDLRKNCIHYDDYEK
ncbi:MAG: hypothetical protein SCJ93_12970, partial [Bacillota bacterium]|nr:hypothetical protein [Bacillota bacterium]